MPIHWKTEVNALTVPQSYKIRFIPNNNLGTSDIAAGMGAINPALTPDLAKSSISALFQTVQKSLINGNHVTLDDSFIFTFSFTGRLDGPDDPLPPIAETLHVRVQPTAKFMKEIFHQAKFAKTDMIEKLPQINLVEDTTLRLNNVLSSTDVLQLTGDNLGFDPLLDNGECVISGTRNGSAVQTQFGPISNTSIILIPTIPVQNDPWNNEYTLSVSVRYTENGTLRTATYRSRLRTPLAVTLGNNNGILTDKANSPYVTVTGGNLSVDETVRIQVLLDHDGSLLFNLLDMSENGQAGETVIVTADGDLTLNGFAGSALSSLSLTVNSFTKLVQMIRENYSGRLVDVLVVQQGT